MEGLEKFVLVVHFALSSHVRHFYFRPLEADDGLSFSQNNKKSGQGYEGSLNLVQISG
jgi:hypothetical protein